jgi:uncharacterized membrane protein YhaH (DUF805 family)
MRAYVDALLRYFDFSGRSTRAQYWLFELFVLVLSIGALYADYRMTGVLDPKHPGPIFAFVAIFHLIPGLTVTVRRLHDIGKSGWWYLIGFVPLVGGLLLLVWTCFASEPWSNDYGEPGGGAPPRRERDPAANPIIERALRGRTARPTHLAAADPGNISTQRFI